MSSNLMDTAPGGESSQYESIQTVTKPHSKQEGQLGKPATEVDATTSQQQQDNSERGERTAENIRYGQSISEGGMGGQTVGNGGSAGQEGGYGRTEALSQGGNDAKESRGEQGYGGDNDMDREIGA